MIEIYIDNHDDPAHVENTVKEFSDEIEHADDVTCVTVRAALAPILEKLQLDILHKRGK